MRHLTVIGVIVLTYLLMLSCEKDNFEGDEQSGIRLKMEVHYNNDNVILKNIYSYKNNKIDTIKYFKNIFNGSIYDIYTNVKTYSYSGNIINENNIEYNGNMIVSQKLVEYEFSNDNIIRAGNELFKYEHGHIVERNDTARGRLWQYQYEGNNLVSGIRSYYDEDAGEYQYDTKLENVYGMDQDTGYLYYFDNNNEIWVLRNYVVRYHTGDQITKRESYDNYGFGDFRIIVEREYIYDDLGDLIQTTSYYTDTEEYSNNYYSYIYDNFGNLLEKVTTNDYSDDIRKEVYLYESGGSNLDKLEIENEYSYYSF